MKKEEYATKNIFNQVLAEINSIENVIDNESTVNLNTTSSTADETYSYTNQVEELLEDKTDFWAKVNVLSTLKPQQLINTNKNNEEDQAPKMNIYEIIQKSVDSLNSDDINPFITDK